ncbi:MAG: hypothetical protein HUU21_12315, partial [Polyangiaceae bacterium]|nr:hypothetical protein [Polyangiaceae bacterium]
MPIVMFACSLVLSIATPARAEDIRSREVRVCVRPPGESLDRWVFSPGGGKVLTERWARMVYGPRNITVYVFDPSAPAISATYFPPRLFNGLKCPPRSAPKKLIPKAPRTKSEAAPRKKTKKEVEEREPEKPKPNERKAEEREEREATRARLKKEADEAKRERERRAKQAQEEERRRRRERERPKVLPREGVTAAWPSKVLPDQKHAGVTAAWSSKVLPNTGVLSKAGTPSCGAPAIKPAGGKNAAATMAVREPILKALLGYKKAVNEAGKEAHRQKLRELFGRIEASAAQSFEAMLSTPNALAVTFRDVLHNDPLQHELLLTLAKKYMPAQCTPVAPAPAAPSGVALPAVTLTDEEAFDELHAAIEQ